MVKVSKDFMLMGREIHGLKAFHSSNPKNPDVVPKVYKYGMFNQLIDGEKQLYSYYVMPRYGKDIEQYFKKSGKKLPVKAVVDLGIKVLEILEMVHNAQYLYGDLKLDNLLLSSDCAPNDD